MNQTTESKRQSALCWEVEINGLKVRLKFAERDNHEAAANVRDILMGIEKLYKAA